MGGRVDWLLVGLEPRNVWPLISILTIRRLRFLRYVQWELELQSGVASIHISSAICSTDCIFIGDTNLEIESVREIHVLGGVNPTMYLRTERSRDCDQFVIL